MFKKMSLLVVAFAVLALSAYAGEKKACCEKACQVKTHHCEKCCVFEVACKVENCCEACETKCVQKCRCKKTKCCCTKCCCETKCKCKVKRERKCLIPVCKVRCCLLDILKTKCCSPCETEKKEVKPEPVPVEPTPVTTIIWGRGIIRI